MATINPLTLNQLFYGQNGLSGAGSNALTTSDTTPSIYTPPTNTQTLPNGGGTYNPATGGEITPAPIFTGATPTKQNVSINKKATLYGPNGQKEVVDVGSARASQLQSQGWGLSAQASAPVTGQPGINYDKYRDPKTGKIMTPEEYAIYLGNKVPKGNGEITNYAGDALTNPNESAAELQKRATNLNISRNDIATGTTDPYKVGNTSGIAYSPAELNAIEKAYAGVYDPALNDVFARLKETQAAEKAKSDLEAARELEIFKTNESIRQWKATTGSKKSGAGTGAGTTKKMFTQTQLNNGASNAGLSVSAFDSLDDDIKNFYINTPMALNSEDKKVPMYQNFLDDYKAVLAGELSADQLTEDITASPIPEAVKHYFIDQIPAEPAKKEGWIARIWNAIF